MFYTDEEIAGAFERVETLEKQNAALSEVLEKTGNALKNLTHEFAVHTGGLQNYYKGEFTGDIAEQALDISSPERRV